MSFVPDATVYTPDELVVDRLIHLTGISLGIIGALALLDIAAGAGARTWTACFVYAASLVVMLVCSAAYHLARSSARRAFLRRLDHAAIFLLIAGTYTPFTTCRLQGAWAIGMTVAVWGGALTGVTIKLISPHRLIGVSTALYLALGWIVIVGIRPFIAVLDSMTLALLALGGIVYSVGAPIHHWRSLRFHNAIWHAMVLIAAACHYAAVVHGVVLAG
jgi:hemolysin III